MNAHTSDFRIPDSAVPSGDADPLALQWVALHDAAAAVAALAGLEPEPQTRHQRDFPSLITNLAGWKQDLARNGVNDVAAIMRPGLTALLAVSTQGRDPAPAAETLWHEFLYARDALLELAPETETPRSHHSA